MSPFDHRSWNNGQLIKHQQRKNIRIKNSRCKQEDSKQPILFTQFPLLKRRCRYELYRLDRN